MMDGVEDRRIEVQSGVKVRWAMGSIIGGQDMLIGEDETLFPQL